MYKSLIAILTTLVIFVCPNAWAKYKSITLTADVYILESGAVSPIMFLKNCADLTIKKGYRYFLVIYTDVKPSPGQTYYSISQSSTINSYSVCSLNDNKNRCAAIQMFTSYDQAPQCRLCVNISHLFDAKNILKG